MIKVIIFDLGGVLFTNGTKRFIEFVSQTYQLDKKKITEVMDGNIGTLYREAKISRDEFWQRFIKDLAITGDADQLEDKWINSYELIEGTRDILQTLSKHYKIYFLSDNVKERIDKINAKHDFLKWFADGVFSYEVGVRKPHPKIYQIALNKTGVKAEEAVFIDDKAPFTIPAQELGMLTFVFETPEKLRKDLKKNSLL